MSTESQNHAVALIVGGTSGIGLATARLLDQRGYSVLVTGKNSDTIATARESLPSQVAILQADARSLTDSARVADEVKKRHGRLDFVFFNAGVGRLMPIEVVSEADFDEHFDVTVKGHFFLLQKLLPLIHDGGSVLFTTAVGAHRGLAAWSVYSASRGAIDGLVPALAAELTPRGIRVNGIRPGPIDTPALTKLGLPEEVAAAFRNAVPKRVPIGRMGSPEEIAEVAAFLATPAARFITGATIDVDGGMSSTASVINLF
jgi:NAD(P)-dependent dehydrogenase (short-subunit alcohol dehydrogenase family)